MCQFSDALMYPKTQSIELVGDGNMQNLLIEGEVGMPAVSLTGGVLKLSNLMVCICMHTCASHICICIMCVYIT